MSFNYQNPLAGVIENQYIGVSRDSTAGNTFSVLNVGGYMEVWTLNNLNYSTFGATGTISNSGNTIPIAFYKRPAPTITDRVTLNSDGISSGRRRIGMMVYVHENDTTYQYQIDDYDTLWSAASADGCISSASTSYTISNRISGVEKPQVKHLLLLGLVQQLKVKVVQLGLMLVGEYFMVLTFKLLVVHIFQVHQN